MEDISFEVRSDAEEKSELAEKVDNLQYLATTIKDLLVRAEEAFLDAIETYDRVGEEEDFDHFMFLYGLLPEADKKGFIKCAILRTQKSEKEYPPSKPGSYLYDIRRSLAKKYGVELNAKSKEACHECSNSL